MQLEIREVRDGKTKDYRGLEIQVGKKLFYIDSNQQIMSGVRVGGFPHPGLGRPDWDMSSVYTRHLEDV